MELLLSDLRLEICGINFFLLMVHILIPIRRKWKDISIDKVQVAEEIC